MAGTSPSHPVADYAGVYEHPAYGTMRVDHQSGVLKLTYEDFALPLEHFHYDVFRTIRDETRGNPLERLRVTFSYNAQGRIDTLKIPLEPSASEIVFRRRPEKKPDGAVAALIGTRQDPQQDRRAAREALIARG